MRVNRNLLTLKCVMFTFFAGVGCLFPFLPLHMLAVGLNREEARIISIIAPFVAILGPAIAGPLSDKLSVGRGSSGGEKSAGGSGKILRLMIAACFLLGAFFYLLLLAVPTSERHQVHRPNVSFTCHGRGAVVFQQICSEDRTCNRWSGVKSGGLVVDQCVYECETSPEIRSAVEASEWSDDTTEFPSTVTLGVPTIPEPDDTDSYPYNLSMTNDPSDNAFEEDNPLPPAPHLCSYPRSGDSTCQVFTNGTQQIRIEVSLRPGTDNITENDTWCAYQSAERFRCAVPEERAAELLALHGSDCVPVVRCRVLDPYDVPGGVLAQSPCQLVVGDPDATFWVYLVIRSVADIFPTAALGLLGAACVVATRETSRGRGDVGRQFAVGSVGLLVFPPLAGLACKDLPDLRPHYMIPVVMFAAFMLIGALILLLDGDMPLSPPEWWWHTANGTLAMPMNTVRRYGAEIAGLFAVMVLLGILWSGLDTYLPWTLMDLSADDKDNMYIVTVCATVAVGALPAIPALWWAETVVDYIGHSNLFITAFTFYAVRYTGMGLIDSHAWALVLEALEVFTLSLVWVTAVLYFRHLVPRKFTSSGQALPVIAHFGIGRLVGAVIGGLVVSANPLSGLRDLYSGLAVASILVAAVYLALYHLLLAPSCAAPPAPPDQALLQGLSTNGNSHNPYSPVRVYHEERGRKAQFRY